MPSPLNRHTSIRLAAVAAVALVAGAASTLATHAADFPPKADPPLADSRRYRRRRRSLARESSRCLNSKRRMGLIPNAGRRL